MAKMFKYFNNYKWVLVFAVLVALAAGFFAWQQDKYSAALVLTVSRLGMQNTGNYQYDGYYALKASDEFGNTVVGWFKASDMASEVYQRAGLDFSLQGLAGLGQRFAAAKISPTTVEIRFSADSREEIKGLSQGIAAAAAQRAAWLNSLSQQGIAFAVAGGEPVVMENSARILKNAGIGLLLGLICGFFVKKAKENF